MLEIRELHNEWLQCGLNSQNILIEHIEDLHFLDSSYMVNEIPYGDEIPFY